MPGHPLNIILPAWLKTLLRSAVKASVPSMRHLDMPRRLRHMKELGFSPGIIIDVGAASGDWSRLAGGIWPEATIIGFEPNEHEQENLERTRLSVPKFTFRRAFLGPRRDRIQYMAQGHQTTLLLEPQQSSPSAVAEMLVLDELIAAGELPRPDLIKADVQGFELEFLKGASEALAHAQAVLLEVNFFRFQPQVPTVDEVIAFMRAAGFVWYDVMGLIRRAQDDALFQMDLMFLKMDHPLRRDSSWGGQA